MVEYLSRPEVLVIHARLIQRTGGVGGVRNMGLLNAAVAHPQATIDGEELYPTLWQQAAALTESLCQNHAFVDGNKRVALVAVGLFLARNGYSLVASQDEAFQWMMQVAQEERPVKASAPWLKHHSRNRE